MKPALIAFSAMIGLLAIIICVGFFAYNAGQSGQVAAVEQSSQTTSSVSQPTYNGIEALIARTLVPTSLVVAARSWTSFPFTISDSDRTARLTGHFEAKGGGHDAISAYIVNQEGYDNFRNNSRFSSVWGTPGELHTSSFDLRLTPGNYYLVFDNRNSIFTEKVVNVSASLLPRQ